MACNAVCTKLRSLVLCCIKYELDGALSSSGCDVVCFSLPFRVIYFIELKGGNITISDAEDTIRQLEYCERTFTVDCHRATKVKVLIHAKSGSIHQLAIQLLHRSNVRFVKAYGTGYDETTQALINVVKAFAL